MGAYLDHDLRNQNINKDEPYVYANFVTSLDGRIAIPHPNGGNLTVPSTIANQRDWRLFQELAAQADLIISSGRYLRDRAHGQAQEILRVDDPKFADLREWRLDQGLHPFPDIAIVSNSLNFPIPEELMAGGRKVIVCTTENANCTRIAEIEQNAAKVLIVGDTSVDGSRFVEAMSALGYQTIYSAAGPRIAHLLLKSNVLNRLYLTYASRILAGHPFSSIVEGALFEDAIDFELNSIYWDPKGLSETQENGMDKTTAGQLFISYNANYAKKERQICNRIHEH